MYQKKRSHYKNKLKQKMLKLPAKLKVHNFEQGTLEWFASRKGKMTASHAQAIANSGKGLATYIVEMMSEFYSSGQKESFSNKHTDRGNELEPMARSMYELERDVTVEQVGFIELDEYTGCSPDGLVGEDGLVEIKSVDDTGYFRYLLNGENEIDTKYIYQIQMELLITERKWCDLIIYNPNFKKSMCVYRILPDQKIFSNLLMGLENGKLQIADIKNKLN